MKLLPNIAGVSSHIQRLEEHCMFSVIYCGIVKKLKMNIKCSGSLKGYCAEILPQKSNLRCGMRALLFCFVLFLGIAIYILLRILVTSFSCPKENSPQLQQQEILETFSPKMASEGFFFRYVYALLCHISPNSFANTIPNPLEYCGLA